MKILKLEWRNIFSYGNKIETLEFDDKGKLWQISGRSGAGKSSLLNIPKLLFYGKAEGCDGKAFKQGSIANRMNKNGWIRGTIKVNNDIFIIERAFSPNSLIVYKNGEDLDKAGLKDMQAIIENEIMDNLPYSIFSNVMTLSLNNFKSFITMTPADKRQIIDKIFSMEVIDKVHDLIKANKRDLGDMINRYHAQLHSLENTLAVSKNELQELENKHKQETEEDLNEYNKRIQSADKLYAEQYESYTKYVARINEMATEESKIQTIYNQVQFTINEIDKKIKLFSEDKCPTCGVSFSSEEFINIKDELLASKREREKELKMHYDALMASRKVREDMNIGLKTITDNLNMILQKKNALAVEAQAIAQALGKTDEYQSIQNIINDTMGNIVKLSKDIDESNARMTNLDIMETLYSANGVKRQIMSTFLPMLNEEIRNTLISLSFPYTLTFDDGFDPCLESLGEKIDVQSLSMGEHKKVDLAVLCSILQLLKRKYPQINLVCLDETLSSLDYESSADVIKHLQRISTDMDLNIFVISHTMLDENMFDTRIYIDKNSGFSELSYV